MCSQAVYWSLFVICVTCSLALSQERTGLVLPPRDAATSTGNNQRDPRISELFRQLASSSQYDATFDSRALHIATYDERSLPAVLMYGRAQELRVTGDVSAANPWWVAPAGAGMVRIQSYESGRVYAVSAQGGGRVALLPLAQDSRQLWRVTGAGRWGERYVLESIYYPGHCLTSLGMRGVAVQPIQFVPTQLWVPLIAPVTPSFQPFYRTVTRDVQVNPPLPPAQVELVNSHRNALLVLLADTRQSEAGLGDGGLGNTVQQIRIAPRTSLTVTLERDAGATIIETVETLDRWGSWERQQFTTSIPPVAYYDLSVYEEHLQSIAIDRTGKSPNPIEDVNYVPKSVGWIPVPTGMALPDNSRLDVYQLAAAARNPGAVRRLDPKQFDDPPVPDRLESLLQEFQPAPTTAPATTRRKF